MQVLLVCFVLIASAFGRSSYWVSEEGPKCPLPDPLDDPKLVKMRLIMNPLLTLDDGSTRENLYVTGLSTHWYNWTMNALLLTFNFESKFDVINLTATYNATGYLDGRPFRQETIPSGNFTGDGIIRLGASGVDIKGHGTLWVNIIGNKVRFNSLTVESVKFDSLSLDLGENFVIGGETIDWVAWSRDFKNNFEQDWAEHQAEMSEKIRLAINSYYDDQIPVEPSPDPEPCPAIY